MTKRRYNTPTKRKGSILKKVLIIFVSFILLLAVSGYIFRKQLLEYSFNKINDKLIEKTNIRLSYQDIEIQGFADIILHNLEVSVEGKKMFFTDSMAVTPDVVSTLFGKPSLNSLDVNNIEVIVSTFKLIKTKKTTVTETESTLFTKSYRYVNLLNDLLIALPKKVKINYGQFFYQDSSEIITVTIDNLIAKNNKISGGLGAVINDSAVSWKIKGDLTNGFQQFNLDLVTNSPQFINLNRLRDKYKSDIGIGSASFKLNSIELMDTAFSVKGALTINGFKIYNEKISKDSVLINESSFQFNIKGTENYIELEPTSSVSLNKIKGNIGLSYHFKDTGYFLVTGNIPRTNAQTFLNSLPEGTFDLIKTMQLAGDISYKLNFMLKYPRLDSAFVDSDLEGHQLKIEDYGDAPIIKLNTAFEYKPFNSKRRIIVGQDNPTYVPLYQIAQDLQDAVTESEDGNFYGSKGFNEAAFAKVIIENIKKKDFKRGGSTISMQLVKNVFLSHKKTVDRKLEEMIITWLMENMNQVSKRRMLEVYLNIIEWGPNVYGVGEACQFYFNKHPAEITLEEAIYLALIVPSPRNFRYQFDKQGNLLPHVKWYYKKISYLMAYRGKISWDERDSLTNNVILTGPAKKKLILEKDSSVMKIDSLSNEKMIEDMFKME